MFVFWSIIWVVFYIGIDLWGYTVADWLWYRFLDVAIPFMERMRNDA